MSGSGAAARHRRRRPRRPRRRRGIAAGDAGAGAGGSPGRARVDLADVSRWYGNVVAVNGVSFSLGAGVTGLLGPNGAGKSTLLHMIAGLLHPSAGAVTVDGRPTYGDPEVFRRVGLVPEREAVFGFLTGREFVRLNADLQGLAAPAEAVQRALETVELDAAADRQLGTYSKGMRQRAKVAAALVHDPSVLVLDEPFNGMDPRQRLHMMDLLRDLAAAGRTILFSSHILEEVERVAERVLVVVAGRLAASGDFREIRRLMTDRPTPSCSGRRTIAPSPRRSWPVRRSRGSPSRMAASSCGRPTTRPSPASWPGSRARAASPSTSSSRRTNRCESVFAYLVRP